MGKFEIYVVLIPIEYGNSRKVCEHIENTKWDSVIGLRKHIETECNVKENDKFHISILSLTNFMDAVNNQDFDDLTKYFISYVQIHK